MLALGAHTGPLAAQENTISEYLRVSGAYWTLTGLQLLGAADRLDRAELLQFVGRCQGPSGGVSGSVGHDPHLLYTLSAVQVSSVGAVRPARSPRCCGIAAMGQSCRDVIHCLP